MRAECRFASLGPRSPVRVPRRELLFKFAARIKRLFKLSQVSYYKSRKLAPESLENNPICRDGITPVCSPPDSSIPGIHA